MALIQPLDKISEKHGKYQEHQTKLRDALDRRSMLALLNSGVKMRGKTTRELLILSGQVRPA